MLNFRDTEIKKKLEPLCMAIINSYEKKLFMILAMLSVSKIKNSVYNLIGLENSCICEHYPGGVRYGSHTPIFKARSSHDQYYDGRKEC